MLSRVADAIYWMGRYVERAENYARFLNVNFNLSLDLPPQISEQWQPLITITGDWEFYRKLYGTEVDKEKAIYFLGFDTVNPNSILSCIIKARENARSVRSEITRELWQQINHIYFELQNILNQKKWQSSEWEDSSDLFVEIKKNCQLLYGIYDTTISRNQVWHFGRIGQMLERADKTSRVLDVKYHILLPSPEAVGSPLDLLQWAALLKSVSSYDMYRRKYGKLTPAHISEFLIFDKTFPRSILRCLFQCGESLRTVSESQEGRWNSAEKKLGILIARLEYSSIDDVFAVGLHEYLNELQSQINEISEAIFKTFFSIEKYKTQEST